MALERLGEKKTPYLFKILFRDPLGANKEVVPVSKRPWVLLNGQCARTVLLFAPVSSAFMAVVTVQSPVAGMCCAHLFCFHGGCDCSIPYDCV